MGARKMAQWLKALAEEPGLVAIIHMVASKQLDPSSMRSKMFFKPSRALGIHVAHIHACKQNTHMHKRKRKKYFCKTLLYDKEVNKMGR